MRRVLLVLVLVLAVAAGVACGRTVVYDPPETKTMKVVDAGPMMKPCMTGQVVLSHAIPPIYFVVDRSGSMAFDLLGNEGPPFGPPLQGPARWDILTDVMGQVLPAHDRDLAMGMMFFPADNECATTSVAAVLPRIGNAQTLASQFRTRRPGGGTPIAGAMLGMRGPAMSAGTKTLILITDGEPNCNELLDPKTCVCTQMPVGFPPQCGQPDVCLDDVRTVSMVAQLQVDAGVTTHVVGFATSDRASITLNNMAIAGGAPRDGPDKFHSAETQAQLAEVLEGISTREHNCTWTALSMLKPDDRLEVRLDGLVIPEGDGWSWLDKARGDFVLRGVWCDRSLDGAVTAVLTCR